MSSEDRQIDAHDRLRRVTVGEPARHAGPILLAAYSDRWPELFEVEAARVRAALGARATKLEHVGSTSVPGLAAKPIIDMCLVVEDSADEAAYLPILEAAGYVLRVREEDWHQHRMFKGPAADINLHVFSVGCPEIERMLAFRDRLRDDGSARSLYERTKQELAHGHWTYVQDYADAKSAVVEAMMAVQPGPPGTPGRRPSGARS
jgi:GrpB-like predicted nucleotidyltransferase (UPF0157 family)